MTLRDAQIMVGTRYRSTWSGQSAIPRLGFLLFILAVAIVGWPKLRLARESLESRIPDKEGTAQRSTTDDGLSAFVATDELPEGLESKKSLDLENTPSLIEEHLGMNGQTRDLLLLVTDNTLRMAKREMPAYWELVRKTANSTFDEIREVSNSKIKFNDFYSQPSKHRGELVSFDIVVRRVTRFEAEAGNPAGASCVYEIWGSTEQSHAWLYVFITDQLPKGFDEETLLRKKTGFAGYFFKLLAYHPGSAPPNSKPLLAPLLIGRLQDIELSSKATESNPAWWTSWGMIATLSLAAVFITTCVYLNTEQKKRLRFKERKRLEDLDPALLDSDRQ